MADTRLLSAGPLEVLKQDHDRIRTHFRTHAQTPVDQTAVRDELFREIRRELRVHGMIERDHVYPVLNGTSPGLADDHVAIEGLLDKLAAMSSGDKSYDALMKLLEENVALHAAAEERVLFPRLERLSPLAAYELTIQLENARDRFWRAEPD